MTHFPGPIDADPGVTFGIAFLWIPRGFTDDVVAIDCLKYFNFHPKKGKMNPFWLICLKWAGSTTQLEKFFL